VFFCCCCLLFFGVLYFFLPVEKNNAFYENAVLEPRGFVKSTEIAWRNGS